MKPLEPRDKVTQRVTRAGLTLGNQTTGKSTGISSRETEPGYTAEPDSTARKTLERAVDIHDRHKAKQAARHEERMAREANGPASWLQFTAEGRASPEPASYIKQAEKRADRLDIAKNALPNRHVITGETVYDKTKGKTRSKLYFEKVEKHPPKLKPNPASRPMQEAGLYLHGEIHKAEQGNVDVESGRKAEKLAERQAGKTLGNARQRSKLKPYRAATGVERESMAANAEFVYQKSLRDSPELAWAITNPTSRLWQRQHIRRGYAKAAQATGRGATGSTKITAPATREAAGKGKQAAPLMTRHWRGALLIGGVGLMFLFLMGGLRSYTTMFGSAGTGLAAASYLSKGGDMLGAETVYAGMEANLQYKLNHYETLHPGYDGYRFELDEIDYDPYILTSIFSVLHNDVFALEEVQGDLTMLSEQQCILTQTVKTEIRYCTETSTDGKGDEYEEEVLYTHYICNVTLENGDLSYLPVSLADEEALSLYAAYMRTLGNRPDLFPSGNYPNASTIKESTYYEISPEALKDEVFATMIVEAEKYVGSPYVWSGNSPSISSNCSGFISWVVNHSDWSVGRQTAQGLYSLCTPVSPEQAGPSDLVFFVGIYDTAGMSHVGLYIGNSAALHYGNLISYTNLNSSYWQQHLYCYGRLP